MLILCFSLSILFANEPEANPPKTPKSLCEKAAEFSKLDDFDVDYLPLVRKCFSSLDKDGLNAKLSSDDDSMSLLAAWERMLRSLNGINPKDYSRVYEKEVRRFIGFVEGRLRITLPDHWVKHLCDAMYDGEEAIIYDIDKLKIPRTEDSIFEAVGDGENGSQSITKTKYWEVFLNGDKLTVRRTDRISPNSQFTAWRYDKGSYTYLLLYEGFGAGCEVMKISIPENKILWRRSSWCDGRQIASSGRPSLNKIELIIDDSKVVVIGCNHSSFFIESFDVSTGENLLRFGTAYLRY